MFGDCSDDDVVAVRCRHIAIELVGFDKLADSRPVDELPDRCPGFSGILAIQASRHVRHSYMHYIS